MDKEKLHRRYLPGLDGIRALAVLAVIIFHLNTTWLKGGFLGVDTFFVISGYLITGLLILEYAQQDRIDLKAFWIRRIKRLIPALLFLLGTVLTFVLIFKPAILNDFKTDILAALFYVSNWWYVFKDVDYFNLFETSPLTHLWSLAIEEQFYIIFPILFIFLSRKFKPKKIIKYLFFISLVSLALMFIIYLLTGDHSRVYFGTDTRFQTLLLGCLFAFIWNPFSSQREAKVKAIRHINLLGFLALLLLILLMFINSEASEWLYYGGFYFISLLTLIVIGASVEEETFFSKVLGHPLLVYIGKRSYSLYIWHFPVIELVHSYYVKGMIPSYVYIVDILLIIFFTELSYRFIEVPIRRHGFKAFSFNINYKNKVFRLAIFSLFLLISFSVFTGVIKADTADKASVQQATYQSTPQEAPVDKAAEMKRLKEKQIENAKRKAQAEAKAKAEKEEKEIAEINSMDISHITPLIIGDSVTVGAGQTFVDMIPNAIVDGKIGRQMIDAIDLLRGYYAGYAYENSTIVIALGSNGDFYIEQLEELIETTHGANVYLVNVRLPREYEDRVNKKIQKTVDKYEQVHLVDWHDISENHPEYFANDGIHLQTLGAEKLSEAIIFEIKKNEWRNTQ